MSAVISDTSPINYLVQIRRIDLLQPLFGEVLIPPAVLRELLHQGAPKRVREFGSNHPLWVKIVTPLQIDESLDLGDGELEAIALAKQIGSSLLLMDERKGRKVAMQHGIRTAGTLNVLEEAAARGLIDFEQTITELRATNFHVKASVLDEFVSRVRARGTR